MVPTLDRGGIGEFENDDALWFGLALDQLRLSAAGDEAPAILRDAGAGERAIGLVSGRVAPPEGRAPARIRGGIEPPGAEPVSRYMTSVPFVALIACPPDDWHWLLNVAPPEKVIVSAISCVH